MTAVDRDMAELGMLKQTALKLGKPDLVRQFAVLVELHPPDASVVFFAVPVRHAEFSQVVEAGCCADDAGLRGAR